MAQEFIDRTLWHEVENGRATIRQNALCERDEPLVILGEAGMGKSCLLEQLADSPEYKYCTARQLINRHNPRTLLGDAKVLVIDALDEVSSQKEGDAVDLVLRQLGALDYPRFIISCRVADWRSATGLQAIREQYPEKPIEFHLEPFDDADVLTYLSATLGAGRAAVVIEHFNTRGLSGLLGNPQTLGIIVDIADTGNLPETKSELFTEALKIMRTEKRDQKVNNQPARLDGLNAAGAAFAGMILSGSEAIVRKATANASEGDLQLADISCLPDGQFIEAMLGTRLFKANGAERFGYCHRRIGEFLAAQWLAKQADTKNKRRRLLSLFHSYHLVPASLRGIHAWLARDPALAQDIIAADPMGLIEYGDADDLTVLQARSLIKALELLASENPRFSDWRSYSLRGIAKPELIDEIRHLIISPNTPFGLCLLVLQAIVGSEISSQLAEELRTLVLDDKAAFATRSAAGKALVELNGNEDWPAILRSLHEYGDESSVRLAIELVDDIGYELFNDNLLVDLVVSYAKEERHTLGVLYFMVKNLPEARLDGVLDRICQAAEGLGKPHDRVGDDELTDFVFHLVIRRIEAGKISAEKLWTWMEPFDASVGYLQDSTKKLDVIFRDNQLLRREIQKLVLFEQAGEKDIWQRAFRLTRRSNGLEVTPYDVIALLGILDPENHSDERWREIIVLTPHSSEMGLEVRAVASKFALHRSDLLDWIEKLADPPIPEWEIKQSERERKQNAKRILEHAEHRKIFSAQIDLMRSGEYSAIIQPAKAYLKLFRDIGESVPAHERVQQWLGEEIGEAAHIGFEVYLKRCPPKPTAIDIAESLAQGQRWDAGYIIVAALAERLRKGTGFSDLSNDRIMAGLFELRQRIDDHAGIEGLTMAIESAIRDRGIWDQVMRQYIEPQLEAKREHVEGLYMLMRESKHAVLGVELAINWLDRYPEIPTAAEAELIDRLIRSERHLELQRVLATRVDLVDDERRRNWDAVGLIVDYEATSMRLQASFIEPELFWHLRRRTGGRERENSNISLTTAQLEWIIATFRSLWPATSFPTGGSVGDTNPWDASEHLSFLIKRLGNDPSEEAVAALNRLRDAPSDGYTEMIRYVVAEQVRIRVEAAYVPPSLDAINAIMRNTTPVSAADLQVLMMNELDIVQAKIKSDDAESWRGFYDDNDVPYAENRCRDHLLGLLRQGSEGITLDPETHVAADKEVDIACSAGALRMPIEIKGQWHSELWRGADMQLDRLYTKDWRADGRGVYLVLWFGDQQPANKSLTSFGRDVVLPTTPEELSKILATSSNAAQEGRVMIFVLDLARNK